MTESAISGPIPSPGKRVAVMRLEDEVKERWIEGKPVAELGLGTVEKISAGRLRRTCFTIREAINEE